MSAAQIPATPIQARVAAFFDELFPLDPVRATATGDHRFDHTWPDMTEAGREARLAFVDRWEAELQDIDPDRRSAGDRADREVLLAELAAMRFTDAELREERWDPMSWIYLLGGGIFPILAHEFAPPAARLTSIAGRLETMPRLLEVAAGQLQGLGDRPVSKLHTETALKNLSGRCCRGSRSRPRRPRQRSASSKRTCVMLFFPRRKGRAAWVVSCSIARCGTRSKATSAPSRSWSAPTVSTWPFAARWFVSPVRTGYATCPIDRCRRPKRQARRRPPIRRSSGASWMPSPPSTRSRMRCSTSAATSSPGSRRSAGRRI